MPAAARRALTPFALVLGALLIALSAGPRAAEAAPITTKKSIWGPVERDGVSQFPIYADLGVGVWQYMLRWDQVAPTRPANPADPADPAYRWPAELDRAVAEAQRYGIEVSLLVMGTPAWANGGKEWRWAPNRLQDFADFTATASRRYPAVRHWMIWGEPTKALNWQPLHPSNNGKRLRGKARKGPRIYARLLDKSYGALKRVSRRNLVIGGNTFTVGTVRPLPFIRALKLPNGRPPRMDLFGHNPFSLREPDLRDKPIGRGFADFNDLDTLVKVLDRSMRKAKTRRQRRLKVFISEYSLPTDHANHEFNFYVDRATQAEWIGRALRIVRGWKRIYTFGYLGLYDDAVRPGGDQVERGLITREGERKPAYSAFRDG